jgi:dephospho-CoA kinase
VSNWPGKYVIGLTGNIATGKSVVRRMLEHLGAYTIDADTLSHRAIAYGAPGYQPTLDVFGKFILDAGGEIDRSKLARIAFNDPEALKQLESIIHPVVNHAINLMIRRAKQPIIVIEAIKLIEGDLAGKCDSIWVTSASDSIQKARLIKKRGMSETEAVQRIEAQSPQSLKTAAANVIIHNGGSFDDTWKEVVAAWKVIAPIAENIPIVIRKADKGELAIQRGGPHDSANIATLITRLSNGKRPQTPNDIMAAFGEKAFLLLLSDKQLVGLAGWQVENLVARTTELYLDPAVDSPLAITTLVTEVEKASQDLQCEASLLFLNPLLAMEEPFWNELGYTRKTPQTLGVQAWQEAAFESQPPNTILFFKQLRKDRILRPI